MENARRPQTAIGEVRGERELPLDPQQVYRALIGPRTIEEKMLRLIRQGRLAKWFSGYGQEAIAVGATLALKDDDYILPKHRNLGVWTARGVPLPALFCQLMGRAGGYTKGRDRTFHFGLLDKRIVGMISHMAAMLPVACGLAHASQYRGKDSVALVFVGDGASREGDFHEALNLAAVWRLPVIFVLENNGYGLSTPTDEVTAVENLADAAAGYGMVGRVVDGNDVIEVLQSVGEAASRGRRGEGPTLLEMKTFRVRGHEEASGTKYVPPELIKSWERRDPVDMFVARARAEAWLDERWMAEVRVSVADEVERAAEYALRQPMVESTREAEVRDLFAPSPVSHFEFDGSARPLRYIDAVSEGLRQAMAADSSVLLLGQDIAEYGGVFKVTLGFVREFGRDRVRNTPIIESGAVGAAMGMALAGLKPVLEIQYADFIACGFNQIVNNLATTHYRWGAPVNVTIRAPYGGGIGAGPFHSQSNEAWFAHVPGLKVLVPATPADAKGLLLSAIDDPNPVLFLEHKNLYRSERGDVPEAAVRVPIGVARVARAGRDVTLVTYGLGLRWALEEADHIADQGAEVEVIDLRSLIPWDRSCVLTSVRKTGRILVLHEATRTAGFGAEVAAEVAEVAFPYLDAPPVRVAAEDLPVPFTSRLEDEIFSARVGLRKKLEDLIAY